MPSTRARIDLVFIIAASIVALVQSATTKPWLAEGSYPLIDNATLSLPALLGLIMFVFLTLYEDALSHVDRGFLQGSLFVFGMNLCILGFWASLIGLKQPDAVRSVSFLSLIGCIIFPGAIFVYMRESFRFKNHQSQLRRSKIIPFALGILVTIWMSLPVELTFTTGLGIPTYPGAQHVEYSHAPDCSGTCPTKGIRFDATKDCKEYSTFYTQRWEQNNTIPQTGDTGFWNYKWVNHINGTTLFMNFSCDLGHRVTIIECYVCSFGFSDFDWSTN